MTEDERKRQGETAPAYGAGQPTAGLSGGGADTAGAGFTYDLDADALYQQYRDRYIQNAKRSMRDTMGQAASLTGGYGSSYSQGVGQQAYDETLRGLTDVIPQLEQNAYNRQRQSYSTLSASILATGYAPSAQELAAAGMSEQQAEALRQAWIAGNPGAAWMQGAMTARQYFLLTGKNPPGTASAAGSGGGSGGRGGGGSRNRAEKQDAAKADKEYQRYLQKRSAPDAPNTASSARRYDVTR